MLTRDQSANGYRLPNEYEWENGTAGTNLECSRSSTYHVGEVAWYMGNSSNQTHEVVKKTKSLETL